MRLVPKNLRNYLQTPTLIGCNFLTITEATCRLLRFALLRSAKPCSLTRFFKYRQTFFAFFNFFFRIPNLSIQAAEVVFSGAFDYALFFQTASTFEDFFRFPLLLSCNPNLSVQVAEVVSSEAFDYALFFQTASTFEDFLHHPQPALLRAPVASNTRGIQQRSLPVYVIFDAEANTR
ncbi:hypothetical protein [Variovorax boronicumulans]|uniref:hypothetical protein n=1 Tax=Variovorax boronicumulans TaxID=436515 RepID=UPI0012FD4A8E|nr:hypothetical protein [Variovorax boronicumulans]